MLYYIDIRLLPDPEFQEHQLMGALYTRLHRLLVQLQTNRIGVSFPGYQDWPPTLGSTLRLLGPKLELSQVESSWLKGMRDHTEFMPIEQVPMKTAHRPLRRIQVKNNPERLMRRQIQRHGLTEQQARERVPKGRGDRLRLPYVVLNSASTGQRFPLFLKLGPETQSGEEWSFNTYGLSNTIAVPWF